MRYLSPALLAIIATSSCVAVESAPVPFPRPRPVADQLPVTTSGIANSLIRGYNPDDWESQANKTYVQNYTSMLAVSQDGILYTNTTWEEGHRSAGTYRNGDCLPDHPSFGTGSGDTVAVGEKLVAYGQWGKVILFDRVPGQALDGKGGQKSREIIVSPEDKPLQISGLALDEANGRLWVATAGNGKVRCFALDGTPIAITPITVPRAGGLALDHTGALWVMQPSTLVGQQEIAGAVFAAPAAKDHGLEFATEPSDKAWYEAAGPNGFVGLELATPTRLASMRFTGAGMESTFVGGSVEVSAVGKDGPWTQVAAITAEPSGWPNTILTLPSATPLKAVRVNGPKCAVRNLAVFALVPAETGAVLRFAADGTPLPQRIAGIAEPTGLSSDIAHKRLLVTAGKPDHQVLAYTGLDTTPTLDATFGNQGRFGVKGGVYAGKGAEIGRIGPQRFDQLRGAGLDAHGNIYVAMVGGMGLNQTRFESYDPKGSLRWQISGLSFIDAADLDPADETSLWSAGSRYRLDYSKPAGDEATHVAATCDGLSYAVTDARINGYTQQIYGMRRIHGQPFMITTQQVNEFAFHRFDPAKSGDIAIPCALFSPWHTGKTWPAHQAVGSKSFMWQDANGDGLTSPDEFIKDPSGSVRSLGWIDDAGNFWVHDTSTRAIKRLTVAAKLDQFGSPHWSYTSPDNRSAPIPAPFADGEIRALRVNEGDGPVYLSGFTKELPNTIGGNVPMGRLLVRYDQKQGELVEIARVELPYDVYFGTEWVNNQRDQSAAISVAGDYVFVGYQRTMNTLVYRADTLALVGRIDLGQQVHTPLIDGPAELIARKRSGANEYLLFYPMYVGNATTMVRWSPTATAWLPSPAKLRVTSDGVAWDAVSGATGYRVERKDLSEAGWSSWLAAGDTRSVVFKDAKAPAEALGHCWRVRALGPTPSDWSFSVFTRE